jgi:hypothetical protein
MSRGPGRIEQAIGAAFRTNPDSTFTIDELAVIAYPGLIRPEKRHRVAVARAAEKVCDRMGWGHFRVQFHGAPSVYFNKRSLQSYALARDRSDLFRGWTTDEVLRQEWRVGLTEPGGAWFEQVQNWCAELDATTLEEDQRVRDTAKGRPSA